MQYSALIRKSFFKLVCVICLLWPAFYNGFPMINPDTGTYISSGIRLDVPDDRSIGYGVFILLTSLDISLWFVIIAQAFILIWLIDRLAHKLLGGRLNDFLLAAIMLTVSITTSAAWFIGQLTPDIFAAILLLAALLFFLNLDNRKKAMTYGVLIFFLNAVHNSNVLIMLALSVILCLYFYKKKWKPYLAGAKRLFLISAASYIVMSGVYLVDGNGFGLSPMSHMFLMSRMAENGILDDYLKQECSVTHYSLCDYQGKLGNRQWDFMWGGDFPHAKEGWIAKKGEYNKIIRGALSKPKYAGMFVLKSLEGTLKQLPLIFIADGLSPELENTSVYNSIQTHFGHQLKEYKSSLQSADALRGAATSANLLIVLFAFASGIAVLYVGQKGKPEASANTIQWELIFGITILYLILNAFITATFSTVVVRFQGRVFWVLPLLCILYLTDRYLSSGKDQQKVSE